jgi:hypothetical protein
MPNLKEQMKQDMILFGLAVSTQQRYVDAVKELAKQHYPKPPSQLIENEIRNYLLALKKRI